MNNDSTPKEASQSEASKTLDSSFKNTKTSLPKKRGKINKQIDKSKICQPATPHFIGWICPACGRGNSPFSSMCPCQGFTDYQVTCSVH